MDRELIPLVIISGLALLAAAVVSVFVPSQWPTIPWRVRSEDSRQGWFWRRVAGYVLCLVVAVSMPFWHQSCVDRVIFTRFLDRTLIEALADPLEAFQQCSLPIGVSCILLMPLCDARWSGRRSETPAWVPTGRVFSHARHKGLTRIATILSIAVVAGLLLFKSLLVGMVSGLFLYLAWMGWSGRSWLEADDVGVNWTGYRFRWEEVASWRIVFAPGTGLDDGTNDCYRLFVVLTNGQALDREDIHHHQLESLFSARVPDKRQEAEPSNPPESRSRAL